MLKKGGAKDGGIQSYTKVQLISTLSLFVLLIYSFFYESIIYLFILFKYTKGQQIQWRVFGYCRNGDIVLVKRLFITNVEDINSNVHVWGGIIKGHGVCLLLTQWGHSLERPKDNRTNKQMEKQAGQETLTPKT